jgi:HEPN domain-containing protein
MNVHDRAREWVRFAEGDLRSARVLLREAVYNEVCFHSQQCVEKLLKAFLVSRGERTPRTHRLTDLLEALQGRDKQMEMLRDSCVVLDQYYLPSRYPDAVIGSKPGGFPSAKDAEEALEIAESVWSAMLGKIGIQPQE